MARATHKQMLFLRPELPAQVMAAARGGEVNQEKRHHNKTYPSSLMAATVRIGEIAAMDVVDVGGVTARAELVLATRDAAEKVTVDFIEGVVDLIAGAEEHRANNILAYVIPEEVVCRIDSLTTVRDAIGAIR